MKHILVAFTFFYLFLHFEGMLIFFNMNKKYIYMRICTNI